MADHFTETVDGFDGACDASRLAPGHVIAGRYAVVSLLGGGGSSFVYRAVDRLLGNEVALKILRSDRVTSHSLARMRREVALARKIQSPHVLRIHDIGETADGTAFLTMEIIDGETLAERLAHGPLPIDEIVRLTAEILEGLAAIHGLGIVHRDVKPSNILIDRDGRAIVGDLGLARQFDSSEPKLTRTEALVGTLHYLSPEQALGLQPDARSDLYSLGVTLFECLTGQLPFERETAVGTLASHISESAPSARPIRPDVPRWLDAFVLRLLEKEPRNRFQSATESLRSLVRKNVPYAWRRIVGPLAVAALLGVIAFAAWISSRPAPLRAILATSTGIRAVDANGNELWRRDGIQRDRLVFLKRKEMRTLIAAIPGMGTHIGAEHRRRLLLINPTDGRTLREAPLPSGHTYFTGFSDEYSPSMKAIDSDHDGNDELVISNTHVYWPFYAVHFDSRSELASLFLVSAGHRFAMTHVDADADGRDEIVFGGVENLMGWYSAVELVRLDINNRQYPGCTQSILDLRCDASRIAWSTLLRPGWISAIESDPGSRVISIRYRSGEQEQLLFDGRRPGNARELTAQRAAVLRRDAFQRLRTGARLEQGGLLEEARAATLEAEKLAAAAGEPRIAEWAKRVRIRLLLADGRIQQGEKLIGELRASPSYPDSAFDAGRQLYLRGDFARAVTLFREGLFTERNSDVGRLKYEFLKGAVLAYHVLGRTDDALDLIDRSVRAYPELGDIGKIYEAAALWLAGRDFAMPPITDDTTDLRRYWMAEFEWQKTHDAKKMLPAIETEIARRGTLPGLLRSLEAEILLSVGREDAAADAIRHAIDWVEENRDTDLAARGHEALVRERFGRITAETLPKGTVSTGT